MEYRVLGPLEVRDGGRSVPLGSAKQRALLAVLLVNANQVVSRDRLIDELWGDEPPETAVQSVQVYVSRLRKLLPPETLLTRPPGYLLEVEQDDLDLRRFESLLADGRTSLAAGDAETASRVLHEALDLWRGPALAEFAFEPFAHAAIGRLEDLRLATIEHCIDADLALGRHADLTGELEALIAENPHRERLRGQLMLALYRSGRQAEALEAYRQARGALDDLGLEPSESLRQLEKAILTQHSALEIAPRLVLETTALPGPLRVASPFPFVGRTPELAALRSLLQLAQEGGGGQIALIGGEAGSGKTRLVREFAHEAADRGALVLYGASDSDVNTPYQPFAEALEFLVRVCDPKPLRDCLGTGRGELTRLLPNLAERLGPLPPPTQADPATERHRLHAAATEVLVRVSRLRPLLVVVDDLHWADAPSLHLFRHLARTVPEARMLLLATYRDRTEDLRAEFSDALADTARIDWVTRFALKSLNDDDVAEFIRRSVGATPGSELSTLANEIRELTDGTPFLVCELWRALVDAHCVEISNGAVRLTQPLAELGSPERVRNVVHYRLSRLALSTRTMLEVAAVAGSTFELSVLAAALEKRPLVDALDEALQSGTIDELPGAGLSYRFTHELVRRALYDRLTSVQRAELHLRVGEALERLHAANPAPVLTDLAHHFARAAPLGDAERAVAYNRRAAAAAMATLAFEEAAALLSVALELVDDDRSLAELACDLGFALRNSGDLKRAEVVLNDGVEVSKAAGDRRLAALAAVELAYLWAEREMSSTESVERELRGAIEIFDEFGDDLGLSKAWHLLGFLEWSRCRFAPAKEHYSRALAHAERAHDRRQRNSSLLALAASAFYGPTPVGEAIELCKSMQSDPGVDRILEAGTTAILGTLNAMAGRFRNARVLAARSISMFDELGLELRVANARDYAASSALLTGDLEAAERELRLAYEAAARLDARALLTGCAGMLGEVLCLQGRFEEAEPFVRQVREVAGKDVSVQLTWRRGSARIDAANGNFDVAEQTLRDAVSIAQETDALNLQADLQVDLASVLLGRADPDGVASTSLEKALALYRRKENAAAIARTEAALAGAPSKLDALH